LKVTPNKAIGTCVSADEVEGNGRGVSFDGVLPVTAIKPEYVREVKDEVRIGDILKAKVQKIMKSGVDISIMDHDCGVVCAFCPRCRQKMDLKDKVFICKCGWKDYKKIPLAEGETPPPSRRREYGDREGGYRGSYGGGERRSFGRSPGGFSRRPPMRPRY
jgi:exosome complex RNA-binding protein Csl4